MPLSLSLYTAFTGLIFVIGLYTLATKRNIIKQLIGVELMINAAHLNFVLFAVNSPGGIDPYALAFVVFSILAGASVITVGALMVVNVYRTYGTMDLQALRRLRR